MSLKKIQQKLRIDKKKLLTYRKKLNIGISKIRIFLIRYKNKILLILLALLLFFVASIFVINTYYSNKLSPYIKNIADADTLTSRSSALVLGAGLNSDGSPSEMLRDRLEVGYQLLQTGKVRKLILSGDNREIDYNEPEAMKSYLMKKGVPAYALVADYAGRRTYDSCYRAKEIFSQTKIYVVTQEFHIVRSVYLCRSLGIDTIGITADLHPYSDLWTNIIRDYVGMIGAVWDIKIGKPSPVLGEKINI